MLSGVTEVRLPTTRSVTPAEVKDPFPLMFVARPIVGHCCKWSRYAVSSLGVSRSRPAARSSQSTKVAAWERR